MLAKRLRLPIVRLDHPVAGGERRARASATYAPVRRGLHDG
jgi:hypothetical protein